jgi:hypothetical protein
MDRRETSEAVSYKKELEQEQAEGERADEYVEENGKKFRIPYRAVRQVVFSNLSRQELVDAEHAARLQYRFMLLEAVLFAKVEFVARQITVTYNPEDAQNRKAKTSLQQLVDALAKEGVHINPQEMQEKTVDYYKDIYSYHFNPPTIREHPPYGYTLEEWKKMKAGYEAKKVRTQKKDLENFRKWQDEYLHKHPELGIKSD